MEESGNMNNNYKRTEWVNNVTPLNAKNMNHLECAIEDLYKRAVEFNQILAKDGIYIQQDLNNNLIIGQNILFTTIIPTEINEDTVYYIIDGDSNLKGVIIRGRIIYIKGGEDGGGSTESDTINLTLTCNIPTLIEYTGDDIITELSWTITEEGEEVTPDVVEITKDDIPLTLTDSDIINKSVNTFVNKPGDTIFSITVRFLDRGIIKRTSITITQTYYSYIGFSRELDTLDDVKGNSKRILINNQYNLSEDYQNGNFNDKYFTVYVPFGLSLSTIYSQGIEVPMEYLGTETNSGIAYKKYRSVNKINPLSILKLVGDIYKKQTPVEETNYYIGWINMDIQDFNNLSDSEVSFMLVKYSKEYTPSYSDYFKENTLFVLAYNNNQLPNEVALFVNDQKVIKNFPEDNIINREDITLDGKIYKLWGTTSIPDSKITVNF